MQILVVVAMIQARYLKSEVEKVSIATALDYGLPGPEVCGNSLPFVRNLLLHDTSKGKQVNIPVGWCEI